MDGVSLWVLPPREGWFDITPEHPSGDLWRLYLREVADDRRRNSDVSKTSG